MIHLVKMSMHKKLTKAHMTTSQLHSILCEHKSVTNGRPIAVCAESGEKTIVPDTLHQIFLHTIHRYIK